MRNLCEQIDALLAMDEAGALVPHGIGGHARELLTAACAEIARFRAAREQRAEEADALVRDWQSKVGTESNSSGDEDEAGFYEGKVEGGIEILNVFMQRRNKGP